VLLKKIIVNLPDHLLCAIMDDFFLEYRSGLLSNEQRYAMARLLLLCQLRLLTSLLIQKLEEGFVPRKTVSKDL
jgi:hypothetical protein